MCRRLHNFSLTIKVIWSNSAGVREKHWSGAGGLNVQTVFRIGITMKEILDAVVAINSLIETTHTVSVKWGGGVIARLDKTAI